MAPETPTSESPDAGLPSRSAASSSPASPPDPDAAKLAEAGEILARRRAAEDDAFQADLVAVLRKHGRLMQVHQQVVFPRAQG